MIKIDENKTYTLSGLEHADIETIRWALTNHNECKERCDSMVTVIKKYTG